MKVPNFTFCSRTGTQDNNFLFLFLNFGTVLQNSTAKKLPTFVQTERDGISAIKFEAARIHVFVALLSLLLELPSDVKINRFAVSAVKLT